MKLIKVVYNYYQSTLGAPQDKFLTYNDLPSDHDDYDDQSDELALFEDEESAKEVIDKLEDGTYYLAHGEAGRPDYEIIDQDDVLCGAVKPCTHSEFKGFTRFTPDENIKKSIDSACKGVDMDDDGVVWFEFVELIDGSEYCVAYDVNPEATQYIYKNGLGMDYLNWDNPSYYKA